MSTPVITAPGSLGTAAIQPGTTGELLDFAAPRYTEKVAFYLRGITQACAIEVLRITDTSTQRTIPLVTIVVPTTEETVLVFDYPALGRYRLRITNNGLAVLTVAGEVAYAFPGRR